MKGFLRKRVIQPHVDTALAVGIIGTLFFGPFFLMFAISLPQKVWEEALSWDMVKACAVGVFFAFWFFASLFMLYVGVMMYRNPANHANIAALGRYGEPVEVLERIDRELADKEYVECIGPEDKRVRRFRLVAMLPLNGHFLFTPSWVIFWQPDTGTFDCVRRADICDLSRKLWREPSPECLQRAPESLPDDEGVTQIGADELGDFYRAWGEKPPEWYDVIVRDYFDGMIRLRADALLSERLFFELRQRLTVHENVPDSDL